MSDKVFVDTNVLVYAHDLDAGERHDVAARLVSDLWATRTAVISVATARKGGASRILTEELSPGRTISGVRIENPFR
jgi:predicted nucleic acid-binding protein